MNKVLVVNTVPTDRNGITNVIFSYYQSTLVESYVMDYVSINELSDDYKSMVQRAGGKIYVIRRSSKKLLSYVAQLQRVIANGGYDAVHIHGNSHTVVIELLAAYWAKCKVRIVHSHSTSTKFPIIHRVLALPFYKLCNGRLACSEKAGAWMYGKKSYRVIRNGINTSSFAFNKEERLTVRKELGWEECVILGHVGDFSLNKNQSFLIDVLQILRNKDINYRLALIGEGEQKSSVKQKVEQLGLTDSVLFTGKIPNVYRYLNAFDIILMPSFHEGLPVTLVEQQANGIRCIVSDSVSREANITGYVSYLPLDVNDWAKEIYSIEAETDKNRCKRSCDSIHKMIESGYDVKSSSQALNDYYNNIILGL